MGQAVIRSLKETGETFVHLFKAPRALWGINISYFFEGLAYFGILTVLGKYLSEDVALADVHAGWVYSLFTGGITAAMLILGGVADKIGVRRALLISLLFMVVGRVFLAGSGTFFESGQGAGSPMFFCVLVGLFVVVIGYGMYQPAAYAGVKQFTNKKTAAIGYAMIYALMNLGAFVSGVLSPPVRHSTGMTGVYWVYVAITVAAFQSVYFILTKKTVEQAAARVKEEDAEDEDDTEGSKGEQRTAGADEKPDAPTTSTGEPRRLLEPTTVVLAVGLIACGGWLLTRAITKEAPPLQQVFSAHAESIRSRMAEYSDETKKKTAAADPPKDSHGSSRAALADLEVAHAQGDKTAFAIAAAILQADAEAISALPAREALGDSPPPSQEHSQEAQTILRTHAVRAMAAAYGLVSPVDDAVVENLRMRLKRVDEDEIPVPAGEQKAIIRIANEPAPKMLKTLTLEYGRTADGLEEALGGSYAGPLASGLVAFQNSAAGLIALEGLGKVGSRLLSERLLADSLEAIAMADSLHQAATSDEAHALTEIVEQRLAHMATLAEEIGAIMPEAAMLSFGERAEGFLLAYGILAAICLALLAGLIWRIMALRPEHPFHNARFTFFIFILIPVQTLFAHNWLTLPYYINRAFGGTAVGENFEFFSNINPILIFILTPVVAAMTMRANVYRMMILGTLVMAAPTFLLVLPANPALLMSYIVLMSIGEAMWQPRFLQLVAEIAPEGKTGIYMGIAQMPWFLTKVITGIYSGALVAQYCPKVGLQDNSTLWLIHGCIAMISPIALILAKGWVGSRITEKHT